VGSHAPVAAILSGALANIGSYGLLRFGGGILPRELEFGSTAVLVLGTASIIYGALQAISRRDTSEVMAYSAIGQVGYVLLALAVGGPAGYAAAVLYSVVNSLNKGVVFLAAGLRGPLVGGAFAVGAFSIAGVPPAAGFVGKIAVFKAAIAEESLPTSLALVALIFLGGALSFLYSFQVYQRRFMKPGSEVKPSPQAARLLVVVLGALVVLLGLWPELLVYLSEAAAGVLVGGAG
jgi:multicomponent Na+:H+ antiporter subunit D